MPRWFEVALTLVLFTVTMLLLRWGLSMWIPTLLTLLESSVGMTGAWALLLAVLARAGFIGFWPRTPEGRLRPLLRHRRG